jgi:hypothetical protein
MSKMIFLSVEIEPFLSSFGSWCIPEPYLDGWIIPSDQQWQNELAAKGIDFTIVEITQEDESEDLP